MKSMSAAHPRMAASTFNIRCQLAMYHNVGATENTILAKVLPLAPLLLVSKYPS